MIDLSQLRSRNEQEIATLFLRCLPLEPLPTDLTRRLRACVLMEVKSSLAHPSYFSAPVAAAAPGEASKPGKNGLIIVGIMIGVCGGLLFVFLYYTQILSLIF